VEGDLLGASPLEADADDVADLTELGQADVVVPELPDVGQGRAGLDVQDEGLHGTLSI
jgi:hypothetical protein